MLQSPGRWLANVQFCLLRRCSIQTRSQLECSVGRSNLPTKVSEISFRRYSPSSNGGPDPSSGKPAATDAIHPAAVPSNKDVRSMLRALLRECSYFPDPLARVYLSKHVMHRFRLRTTGKRSKIADVRSRFGHLLDKAAGQALNILRRANAGERAALLRVLSLAYGRTGYRRHQLLLALEQRELDISYKQPVTHQDAISRGLEKANVLDVARVGLPRLSPAQEAILASHKDTKKLLRYMLPETNTWERRMPVRRVRNYVRKWHAQMVWAVLPPLPDDEWEWLQRVVSGKENLKLDSSRRVPSLGFDDGLAANDEQPSLELRQAVGLERIPSLRKRRRFRLHTMTPRFMRRLYVEIFKKCPKLTWDARGAQWLVAWGEAPKNGLPAIANGQPASNADLASLLADAGFMPGASAKPPL